MQKLLYILFCITLISCNSKTEEIKEEEVAVFSDNGTTIYESDIYEVINAFFENKKETDSLEGYNSKEKLLTISLIEDYAPLDFKYIFSVFEGNDSLFKEDDKDFIIRQTKELNKLDLNKNYISNYKIIPKDTMDVFYKYLETENKRFWDEFPKKFQGDEINSISLPIFNSRKDIAIITIGRSYGPLSGSGFMIIYKKENGKWIQQDGGLMWIS